MRRPVDAAGRRSKSGCDSRRVCNLGEAVSIRERPSAFLGLGQIAPVAAGNFCRRTRRRDKPELRWRQPRRHPHRAAGRRLVPPNRGISRRFVRPARQRRLDGYADRPRSGPTREARRSADRRRAFGSRDGGLRLGPNARLHSEGSRTVGPRLELAADDSRAGATLRGTG